MRSVLIVDEDEFTRNVFAQTLSSRGFEVRHASTMVDALAAVEQCGVDLVVVDRTLEDADGVEFIEALRDAGSVCRVVVLSSLFASDVAEYDELINRYDVSLILHKPISPVEFCAQVEMVLEEPSDLEWTPIHGIDEISEAEGQRLAYLSTIEMNLDDLESVIESIRDGAHAFERAHESAATLRSTASRYGFFEISRAAVRIEEGLEVVELRGAGDSGIWADLNDAMEDAFVAARHPSTSNLSGTTILVVDDDPLFLDQVRDFGREHMINVLTARNPDELLRAIRNPAIEAMLVDVDLGPSVNTFELIGRLRERTSAQGKPLGFIADRGTVPDRVAAAHLGASIFIEKPLDATQFADTVQRLITSEARDHQPVVVVVDRDVAFVEELSHMLAEERMQPRVVHSSAELIERIDDIAPDGLVVAISMPGIGGFDLCRMVRAMPRWHDLPILLVGDQMGPDTRIAAFRSGADDVLAKPIVQEELFARLDVRFERLRLLRRQASFDMLTGLLSRRPFLQLVNGRLSEARRAERPLALALIDIDGFKSINDSYGHVTGDRVLAAIGRLLTSRFRMEDVRGRWGGEEFAVALIDEDAQTAGLVLQRTLEEFRSLTFLGERGESFSVTFSAGIAVFPEDGDTFRALLAAADARLYEAKARGKNCIVAST